MKTVADLVRARSASFCMDVFAGKMPRASLEVSVRGKRRSFGMLALGSSRENSLHRSLCRPGPSP